MPSEISNKSKKSILKDPLAYYSRHFPDADKTVLADLEQYTSEYRNLKDKQKGLQNRSHEFSHMIGQARKNHQPVVDLIKDMKDISKQVKTSSYQLSQLEDIILEIVTPRIEETSHDTKAMKYNWQREYPGSESKLADIQIRLLEEDKTADWNDYVKQNKAASLYHLNEWRNIIMMSFGHPSYYLYAHDTGDNIVGILPLIRLQSRLFGDFLVSVPYFNYGGAVADTPEIERYLIEHANNLAQKLGVQHIEFRDDLERQEMPARTNKVNMMLALPNNIQDLWEGFTPKLRAQIRRPQRENPDVHLGHLNLLDDFYRVFSINMRDLGTPVYHKSFFSNILSTFPENSHILVIKHQGKTVSAAFLVGYKDTLEIPWASSLRKVNHMSMNMMMYWEVLKFAIRNDFRYFDFGRSSKNAGTFRFKQQWGAIPKPLYWHYWLRDGNNMPLMNPTNPKYALMINIWKRLPISLTKWIGPSIVKNLP